MSLLNTARPNRSVVVSQKSLLEVQLTAQLVAIKTIKKRTADYKDQIELLREEAALLSTLDHVHIIRLLDGYNAGPFECFVMEYCKGGDLRGAIEDAKQKK